MNILRYIISVTLLAVLCGCGVPSYSLKGPLAVEIEVAGTDGGGVFSSTNNGANWSHVSLDLPFTEILVFTIKEGNIFTGVKNLPCSSVFTAGR